jgi:hypothetical protein
MLLTSFSFVSGTVPSPSLSSYKIGSSFRGEVFPSRGGSVEISYLRERGTPWVREAIRILDALKGLKYMADDRTAEAVMILGEPEVRFADGEVLSVLSRWDGGADGSAPVSTPAAGVIITETAWKVQVPGREILKGGDGIPASVILYAMREWRSGRAVADSQAGSVTLMNADTARTFGIVQEINRQLLHPRGLALAIEYSFTNPDANALPAVLTIQDHRLDPEGIWYGMEGQESVFLAKAGEFHTLLTDRVDARMAALGYVIQPLPHENERYRVTVYPRDEEPRYDVALIYEGMDQEDAAVKAVDALSKSGHALGAGWMVAVWLDGFDGEQPDVFEVSPAPGFVLEYVIPEETDAWSAPEGARG